MNSCAYYQELISRLVDGELSRSEQEALTEHMKNCSACNAMYAVFHDLSDILAEESEPLPAGLHENIMAGVRRSEIIKKNRRMRKIGLSTALSAAACAVLVLFAAAGFAPGKRAESVSIRTEEAASRLAPSPAPVITMPEDSPAEPAATPAPTAAPMQAPVQMAVPADNSFAAGGDANIQYSAPEQSYTYQPVPAWTPAPVQQAAAPTVEPAPAVIAPQLFAESEARSEETAPAQIEAPVMTESLPVRETALPERETALPVEEEETGIFSLFSSMTELFGAAPEEAGTAADSMSAAIPELAAAEDGAAAEEMPPVPENRDAADTAGMSAEEKTAEGKTAEEKLSVYGKTMRTQLMTLLAGNEEALPEAELTRLVHVTLVPEDAYGSEERLDIRIYGDFVFWQSFLQEGAGKCFRAGCALRDLESFLDSCRLVSPSPAPTADPFAAAPET